MKSFYDLQISNRNLSRAFYMIFDEDEENEQIFKLQKQ